MPRFDPRVLTLVPVIMLSAACGDDPDPVAPPPLPPSASLPASVPSAAPSQTPEPDDSVYVEEDEEPTDAPGDLSGDVQGFLDEALATELGALEGAPAEAADSRRALLDKLPENPSQVLTALKSYPWYSPEAKTAYDKAVAAAK